MVFSGPREISINNVQEIHSSDLGQRPGFPCGIRYQERGHIGEISFKLVIEAYMENTDIKHWTRNRNACNIYIYLGLVWLGLFLFILFLDWDAGFFYLDVFLALSFFIFAYPISQLVRQNFSATRQKLIMRTTHGEYHFYTAAREEVEHLNAIFGAYNDYLNR
jgi:hypothetical protein